MQRAARDVLEEIVGYLPPDELCIRTTSLLCQSWKAPAQAKLFRRIRLSFKNDHDRYTIALLSNALKQTPALGKLVRHLHIVRSGCADAVCIQAVVTHLPLVHTLRLEECSFRTFSDLQDLFSNFRSSLRTLDVAVEVRLRGPSSDADPGDRNNSLHLFDSLESLKLSSLGSVPELALWLMHSNTAHTIRTLFAVPSTGPDIAATAAFMRTTRDLRTLHLDMYALSCAVHFEGRSP
jgi:hypothetical protein